MTRTIDPLNAATDEAMAAQFDQLVAQRRAPHPSSPLGKQLRAAWERDRARKAGASKKKVRQLAKSQITLSSQNKPGSPSGDGRGDLAGAKYDTVVASTLRGLPKSTKPFAAATKRPAPPGANEDEWADVEKARASFETARRALVAYEALRNPQVREAVMTVDDPASHPAKKGSRARRRSSATSFAKSAGKAKKKMSITEFEELDPDRVDGVEAPANGVPFLVLKSLAH